MKIKHFTLHLNITSCLTRRTVSPVSNTRDVD